MAALETYRSFGDENPIHYFDDTPREMFAQLLEGTTTRINPAGMVAAALYGRMHTQADLENRTIGPVRFSFNQPSLYTLEDDAKARVLTASGGDLPQGKVKVHLGKEGESHLPVDQVCYSLYAKLGELWQRNADLMEDMGSGSIPVVQQITVGMNFAEKDLNRFVRNGAFVESYDMGQIICAPVSLEDFKRTILPYLHLEPALR